MVGLVGPTVLIDLQMSTDLRRLTFCCYDTSHQGLWKSVWILAEKNCFQTWTKCNESSWSFIKIAMHSHSVGCHGDRGHRKWGCFRSKYMHTAFVLLGLCHTGEGLGACVAPRFILAAFCRPVQTDGFIVLYKVTKINLLNCSFECCGK